MPRGKANYYDMLGADAFGNFRQLLDDVTLNPMMGQFLSMQGNDKGDANTIPTRITPARSCSFSPLASFSSTTTAPRSSIEPVHRFPPTLTPT